MWLESIGVASGCGCKEINKYHHIIPSYFSCTCICFFCSNNPTFCSFFLMFFVLVYIYGSKEV